jgi:predicted NACHT family NTPase
LEQGQGLVLLDGLDEVSDPGERFEVQEAIKAFIEDVHSKASGASGYNRFLITSRVAGYDKNAFPAYPHYTIAELTPEQIKAFLPRWCRAGIRSTHVTGKRGMSKHGTDEYNDTSLVICIITHLFFPF